MGNATLPVYEMQNGYADTWDVGGSRWPLYSSMAFDPDTYVGSTTVTPIAVLSVPPTYGQLAGGSGAPGYDPLAQNAAAAPWNPKHSPTPLVLIGLAIALYGLHWLYYKEHRR